MSINIRYRLIQFVEILLWLGAAAGLGQIASRLWAMRDQGWRAMLDVAVPGLLGIGAAMAALIVLIGIYHNTRRQGDALYRMAKQGAGAMRRLPGAARAEAPPAAAPAVFSAPAPTHIPAPTPVPPPEPVAQSAPPVAAPVVVPAAPSTVEPAPVIPHVEPAATAVVPAAQQGPQAPSVKPVAPAPVLRGGRRLGPAN